MDNKHSTEVSLGGKLQRDEQLNSVACVSFWMCVPQGAAAVGPSAAADGSHAAAVGPGEAGGWAQGIRADGFSIWACACACVEEGTVTMAYLTTTQHLTARGRMKYTCDVLTLQVEHVRETIEQHNQVLASVSNL